MQDGRPARRVAVVGVTGSGKTTLAAAAAGRLGVPHIEMDALAWGPDWTLVPREVVRTRMSEAVSGEAWVTDGNYSYLRDIVWPRADTVVWLDYPLLLALRRLTRRSVSRIVERQVLWHGNRETWRAQFFSRTSLFVWALQSYPKLRKRYADIGQQPEYEHLRVVRLRRPQEAEGWLRALPEGERRG